MQYISETANVAMTNICQTSVPPRKSLANDPLIQRTREILIIILSVLLGLSVATLKVGGIFGSGVQIYSANAERGPPLSETLLFILFYGFGIFVAYRCSSLGLRSFAWLSIIEVVSRGIVLIFFIIAMVDASEKKSALIGWRVRLLFVTFLGIAIARLIISVLSIKFAFELARRLDANKKSIIQQS